MPTVPRLVGAVALAGFLVLGGCVDGDASVDTDADAATQEPFQPRTYVIQRATDSPTIDGQLTERSWREAAWTAPFVDSRGRDWAGPPVRTRAKMMWDEAYLYVAAELEEPDVRASFTTRDTTVWRENAFEIFLDPTADTHRYYELQVNARETRWDLLLTKPYRDGGQPISAWDIRGLKKAVAVDGTLNNPSDDDEGWTVELALPWSVLSDAAPRQERPEDGDRWRVNLTRMQWPVTIEGGEYVRTDEDNWSAVWSPLGGDGDFHRPERWGVVQFVASSTEDDPADVQRGPNVATTWALRRLYYQQQKYHAEHGRYARSLEALDVSAVAPENGSFDPRLEATQSMYEITARGAEGSTLHIRHDGKAWSTGD